MNRASLRRIERLNYILGGLLIAVSPFFMNKEQALGLLVGVILGSVNFTALARIVEGWLTGAARGNHKTGFFLIPKMSLLMVAVFLALWFLPISGITFVIGFSIFILSIAVETTRWIMAGGGSDEVPNGDDPNLG